MIGLAVQRLPARHRLIIFVVSPNAVAGIHPAIQRLRLFNNDLSFNDHLTCGRKLVMESIQIHGLCPHGSVHTEIVFLAANGLKPGLPDPVFIEVVGLSVPGLLTGEHHSIGIKEKCTLGQFFHSCYRSARRFVEIIDLIIDRYSSELHDAVCIKVIFGRADLVNTVLLQNAVCIEIILIISDGLKSGLANRISVIIGLAVNGLPALDQSPGGHFSCGCEYISVSVQIHGAGKHGSVLTQIIGLSAVREQATCLKNACLSEVIPFPADTCPAGAHSTVCAEVKLLPVNRLPTVALHPSVPVKEVLIVANLADAGLHHTGCIKVILIIIDGEKDILLHGAVYKIVVITVDGVPAVDPCFCFNFAGFGDRITIVVHINRTTGEHTTVGAHIIGGASDHNQ